MQTKELARLSTRGLGKRNTEGSQGVHPRGDRKSAEAIENRRDGGAPSRKRVRNRMTLLGLQGCDRKQRS